MIKKQPMKTGVPYQTNGTRNDRYVKVVTTPDGPSALDSYPAMPNTNNGIAAQGTLNARHSVTKPSGFPEQAQGGAQPVSRPRAVKESRGSDMPLKDTPYRSAKPRKG